MKAVASQIVDGILVRTYVLKNYTAIGRTGPSSALNGPRGTPTYRSRETLFR